MRRLMLVLICGLALGGVVVAADKTVEIAFFHFMNTPYIDQMQRLGQIFEKENPGFKLVQEGVSGDNFQSTLRARVASGNTPDLFMTTDSGVALQQWVEVVEDLTNEPFWSQISPAGAEAASVDGRRIAFPFTANVWGIAYNKDVFQKAGITQMPLTLSALKDLCARLKAKGITPFGEGFKDAWVLQQLFRWPFGFDLGGYKDILARFNQYNAGTARVKDDKWLGKLLDLLTVIRDNSQPNPFNTDWNMQSAMLGNGEVAMITQGDWAENPAKKVNPNAHIGMMMMPFSEDPKDARIFLQSDARSIFVAKGKPNVPGAKRFLNWMVSKSVVDWYNNDLQNLAPIKGVKPAGNMVELLASAADLSKDSAKVGTWAEFLMTPELVSLFPTIQEEFMAGKKTKQEVIDYVDAQWYKYSKQ